MVEDWTRERGKGLIGFVGVLDSGVLRKGVKSTKEFCGLIVIPYKPVEQPAEQESQQSNLVAEAEPVVENIAPQTSSTNQNPE